MAPMRVYYDRDADVNLIKGKKVLVVGYGSQGHAHAMNLRDSGVKDVRIALKPGSATIKKAEEAGFKVMSPAEGAKWADIVMVLTPDELQSDIYNADLAPNMRPGSALAFAHGLNVHFNLITPRTGHRRVHDRAQGPRPHRALRIPARRRRALPGGGGAELVGQRARDRAQLLLGDRRRPRRHHRDHLQGRVRDRPVRRAGRAVRRPGRADQGGLRDPGRGGLRAGDGLFRVPARGEADRRPDLRGRHRQHELLDLQHRGIRRVPSPARASSPTRPGPR